MVDFQSSIESAINAQSRNNEKLVREIKSPLIKLAALLDPKLAGAYRGNLNIPAAWKGIDYTLRTEGKEFAQFVAEMSSAELGDTGVLLRSGLRENLSALAYSELDEGISSTPVTAQQMQVVSTSPYDKTSDTGIQSVKIYYIDSTDKIATEHVDLNGTTSVNTVATDIKQVNAFLAETVGSSGFAAGNISLQNTAGTNTYAGIAVSQNSWRAARFYVPSGSNAFIYGWTVGVFNGGAKFEIDASTQAGFDKPLIERAVLYATEGLLNQLFTIPIKVPGPGRITVRALAQGGTSTDVSATYMLLLLNSSTNLP